MTPGAFPAVTFHFRASNRPSGIGAVLVLLALLSVPDAAAQNNGAFSDQTAGAGISASYSGLVHSFLAGGAVGDFNRDGWQDFFYPSGGSTADRLFLNDGDGTFTDVAAAWGVAASHLSTAAAVGDYNGDGWPDIFVTSLGTVGSPTAGNHRLYRNNGDGTFTDVATAAGVNQSSASGADGWGACWGDYDLDGDLDLAVAGWQQSSDGNRLFRNDGDGTFTDVTNSVGLHTLANGTNGFAPRIVDMDGDRHPEIIWIGDFSTGHYFANDGDGTFTDITGASGTNLNGTEMGMTVADWDEDGDFDFYVTTINTNNLYINQGGNSYNEVAGQAGVMNTGWGWATLAVDFNHDTRPDIIATAQSGRNYAFVNNTVAPGPLSFTEVATSIGIGASLNGRGLANLDVDNDGDQDILAFPRSGSVKLFRNDLSGADTHWLRVFLDRGTETSIPPQGVGAVVKARIGARTLMGRIDGGSNYLSQSEMSAHFGLGAATVVDELRIEWPDGSVTTRPQVAADQTITVTAGQESLFASGFEEGDTSAWTVTSAVPRSGKGDG